MRASKIGGERIASQHQEDIFYLRTAMSETSEMSANDSDVATTPAQNQVKQFVPRPPNPLEPTLIWRMSQTRVMFKEHKLWPSFVGARNESATFSYALPGAKDKAGAVGLLPVLLWPEQEIFLKETGFDLSAVQTDSTGKPNSSSSIVDTDGAVSGKKRRIDEVDSDTEAETKAAGEREGDVSVPSSSSSSSSSSPHHSHKKSRTSAGDSSLVGRVGSFLWAMLAAPLAVLLPSRKETLTNQKYQQTVFNECVKMGYFVGPGDIYGGDYNIYRGGDPSNSHSTATVRVVRKQTITGRDLLSFSRVQNQVAKSAVLAYVDPHTQQSRFLVANFRNVSDRM